nr:MAG TPA: hypothetical protein [Caudoviricetes sp.]
MGTFSFGTCMSLLTRRNHNHSLLRSKSSRMA